LNSIKVIKRIGIKRDYFKTQVARCILADSVQRLAYVYPQLKQNPHFGKNIKKLLNYNPDTWRYRISSYRFFYEIDDQSKIVFMISADNRQNAY